MFFTISYLSTYTIFFVTNKPAANVQFAILLHVQMKLTLGHQGPGRCGLNLETGPLMSQSCDRASIVPGSLLPQCLFSPSPASCCLGAAEKDGPFCQNSNQR